MENQNEIIPNTCIALSGFSLEHKVRLNKMISLIEEIPIYYKTVFFNITYIFLIVNSIFQNGDNFNFERCCENNDSQTIYLSDRKMF